MYNTQHKIHRFGGLETNGQSQTEYVLQHKTR